MPRVSSAFVAVVVCAFCFGRSSSDLIVDEIFDDVELPSEPDVLYEGLELGTANSTDVWEINWDAPLIKLQSAPTHPPPRDCADLFDGGIRKSGVYTIHVGRNKRPLNVYCDMTTSGGGWTVFQRRLNGDTNFYREWTPYVNGFGSVHNEYWLGNYNIHLLTLHNKYTLRIDMTDFQGGSRFAEYTDFKIGGECEKYKLLSVGAYCGTAGDSLTYHVGCHFSTPDKDHDNNSRGNCATDHKGAWWYNSCHRSNLNGKYLLGSYNSNADGMCWFHWRGDRYSLKTSEMKLRPADFRL